jgi:hypothetical protein
MRKITASLHPAATSNLIEASEIEQFRLAIERLEATPIQSNLWDGTVSEYRQWEQSVLGMSKTNYRLQLLKIVSEKFPDLNLRSAPALIDLTLADLRKPGEFISAKLPNGTVGGAKIVRRDITERLGVLYTLESADGLRFTHEFFD